MKRKTISQLLAIGAASISTFSCGMTTGFPTILIPELRKNDAEIVVTTAQLTWIASLNFFFQPVGVIIGGLISRHLGRRSIIALSTIPCAIAWLLLHFSGSAVWPLILAFILLGITSGLTEGPNEVYLSEISEPRLRGINASIMSLSHVIGDFSLILVGSLIYWRTLALINVIIPISAFVALYFVPESPYWLARKGRINESKQSLAWLRGWTTPENVSTEFSSILEISQPKTTDTNTKPMIRRYFRRSVLLPFALLSFQYATFAFSGAIPIIAYAVPVFKMLDCPINYYMASALLAGLQIIGAILMLVLVPWIGKRKTVLASVSLSGIAMLVVVIYTFLKSQGVIDQIQSSKNAWVPTLFLALAIFATSFGIKCIPWIMLGEIFPGDVRAEVTGAATTMANVFCAIASKILLYMIDSLTLTGTFFCFAIVNFVGLVVLYFAMPETEGRTLTEIERYFEGYRDENEEVGAWKNKKIDSSDR